jgi:enediyne biosynthesis protein E4
MIWRTPSSLARRNRAWAGLTLSALTVLALSGCAPRTERAAAAPGSAAHIQFTDVAAASGVTFKHTSGRSGQLLFPETVGSGCAIFDYNSDGRPDLFLVNGTRLPGFHGSGPFYPALYRNAGSGPGGFPTFEDVTHASGLAFEGYGMGVAIGDYDNDGRPDLYLTAMGPNHLFHNNGDGTFADVTRKAGVGDPRWSTAAAWLDYDRDGKLDLVVGSYCRWTPQTNRVCVDAMGARRMCRPSNYQGQAPALYHNNGDGTFTDVAAAVGLGSDVGKTLGICVWDADGDGWPDLFVANDGERNRFYLNRPSTHGRHFEEQAVEAGLAYGVTGIARAGMGVDTADFANNGVEAVAVGNFAREGTALFLPDVPGHYSDVAAQRGLFTPSLASVTFGVLFCDVDLDGYRDLITTNGHVDPGDQATGSGITFAQRALLFHNEPAPGGSASQRTFREMGQEAGPAFQTPRVGRGLAAGDLDGDGDPDLLINVNNGRAVLLRNDLTPRRHWLSVALVGTRCNRDALGARVAVTAGGMRQQAWRRGGSSFCSQSDPHLLFGLGDHDHAEKLEIFWPDGAVQTLRVVKADQVIVVKQAP